MLQTVLRYPVLMLTLASASVLGAVVGKVVENRSGQPLAHAEVQVFRAGSLAAVVETDARGDFRAELPEGEYRLEISKPNYLSVSTASEKRAGAGLVVRLIRLAAIEGRIAAQGTSDRTSLRVSARPVPKPLSLAVPLGATVQADGGYRISGLPPGQYMVAFSWESTPVSWEAKEGVGLRGVKLYPDNRSPQVFTLKEGEELRGIDFELAPAELFSVKGRVNPPAVGARFRVALALAGGAPYGYGLDDVEGDFHFRSVAAGSYTLLAAGRDPDRPAELLYARLPIEVAGGDVEGISVVPQKGRLASFVLRTRAAQENGCPRTAILTLEPMMWGGSSRRKVQLTVGKPQTVDGLPPDRYRVAVDSAGACYGEPGQTVNLEDSGPGAPVEVWIAPPGSVEGKLTGAEPNQNYSVALSAPGEPLRSVFTGSDFDFQFDGLRPGRYRLAVQLAEDVVSNGWRLDPERLVDITVCSGCTVTLGFPAPKPDARPR